MALIVGQPIHEPLYLGSTGVTLIREYSEIDGTATTFTIGLTEQDTGNYLVTYTPSASGRHVWRGRSSNGIPGISFTWDVQTAAQADPASALSGYRVTTVSPIAQSGLLTIKRGDDYYAADGIGRTIQWIDQYSRWPDLTDALITFGAKPNPRTGEFITVTGSVVVPTGEGKTIQVEFVTTDTEGATLGTWDFDIQAVTSPVGHNVTLVTGEMIIEEDFVP